MTDSEVLVQANRTKAWGDLQVARARVDEARQALLRALERLETAERAHAKAWAPSPEVMS